MVKKAVLSAVTILVVLFVGLWSLSSSFRGKVTALGDVGGTLVSADCNYVPVVQCGAVVLKAEHNVDVITQAADYLVAVGGNTQVFMEIAKVAANAEAECPRLDKVLDLAVMKQSESVRVLALARSACGVQTEEQVAQWESEYEALVATAEYASVEAGLASRRRN